MFESSLMEASEGVVSRFWFIENGVVGTEIALGRCIWKGEGEGGSFAFGGCGGELAIHAFGKGFGEGESDTGTLFLAGGG